MISKHVQKTTLAHALMPMQATWGDAVESQDESIEHRVQHMELVEQLHNLLGELSERQQTALKLSYGLDGHPPLRQYEVGSPHGVQLQGFHTHSGENSQNRAGWRAAIECLLHRT